MGEWPLGLYGGFLARRLSPLIEALQAYGVLLTVLRTEVRKPLNDEIGSAKNRQSDSPLLSINLVCSRFFDKGRTIYRPLELRELKTEDELVFADTLR